MFLKSQAVKLGKDIAEQYAALTKADDHGVNVTLDWGALAGPVANDLQGIYRDGGAESFAETGTDATFDQLNELAQEYARTRSAELVGKKWIDGELVDNPNAEWAITDWTRETLRGLVEQAFTDGWTPKELQDAIEESTQFSEQRAELIAETELSFAQSDGSLEGWKASGVVSGKEALLSSEHDDDDECDENADAGVIPIDEPFPSGDDTAPFHVKCSCDVVGVVDEGS